MRYCCIMVYVLILLGKVSSKGDVKKVLKHPNAFFLLML